MMLADDGVGGAVVIIIIVGIFLYFLPSIIAISRGVNTGSVIVINTFLGWTLIGWVAALAMAAGSARQPVVVQQFGPSYGPGQSNAPAQMMPPGWYQDPWGRAARRYWNGVSWTDQTAQ